MRVIPPSRHSHPHLRHSCESRNPRRRGGGGSPSPLTPSPTPTNVILRRFRDEESGGAGRSSPTLLLLPRRRPPSPFLSPLPSWERIEVRVIPPSRHSHPHLRHSCESRNPRRRGGMGSPSPSFPTSRKIFHFRIVSYMILCPPPRPSPSTPSSPLNHPRHSGGSRNPSHPTPHLVGAAREPVVPLIPSPSYLLSHPGRGLR